MSDLNSLTKVTKQEMKLALKNWREQREKDMNTYRQRLEKWASEFEFTWWQRNVKKLHLLSPEDLLVELHGRLYLRYGIPYVDYEVKERLGLSDKPFRHTLHGFGVKWKDVVTTLVASGKDEHLVCSGVLSWVSSWRDHSA